MSRLLAFTLPFCLLLLFTGGSVLQVAAQDTLQQKSGDNVDQSSKSGSLTNPLKVNSISALLVAIIDILLIFITPIIVLFIMYAGFLFATARGNPEQLKKAKDALLWSIIGGVIVLGATLIGAVIKNTVDQIAA